MYLQILTPDKFEEKVAQLRKRFVTDSTVDTLFKPAYHKRIPADGVSHYMEGIWVRASRTCSSASRHSNTF